MGISLIVTKSYDRDFTSTGQSILCEEWIQYVERSIDLRIRTEDHVAKNPMTGEEIRMPAGEGEAALITPEGEIPFLTFCRGELVMLLGFDTDDESDPIRNRVAKVAKHFSALVTHDAGDEIFDW